MSYPSEFMATVLSVGAEVSKAYAGDITLLDCATTNFGTDFASVGGTVSIAVPGAVTVSDGTSSPTTATLQTLTSTALTVTLDKNPYVCLAVPDYYQVKADPNDIKQAYVDRGLKAIADKVDSYLAALFVVGTMNTHTQIASASPLTVTLAQISAARKNLGAYGVPIEDIQNMFLVTPRTSYENMIVSDDWSKNDTAGYLLSDQIRRTGVLREVLGANLLPNKNLNVTTQYNSALFHRDAIALAVRTAKIPEGCEGGYINYRGLPIRVYMQHSIMERGDVLNMDIICGVAALRKEACNIIYSALS